MGIKKYNAYTPSRRHMTGSDFKEITKTTPEKSLVVSLNKNAPPYVPSGNSYLENTRYR